MLSQIVKSNLICNKKLDAIDVPYRDPDFFRTTKHFVAPVIQSLEVCWQMRFVRSIADDIFLEIGTYLRNKIAAFAIALYEIIHLGFENLLDMRLFDIIRGDVEADTNGSNDNNAEYCKCQCNTQA